jgi:hypothetical protein
MDIVYPCRAGLDVHKDNVVVTVRRRHADGSVRAVNADLWHDDGPAVGVG